MTFAEALKKLDELEAGEVPPEAIDELTAELELSICNERRQLIATCKQLGYSDGEIEDGLVRFDRYCDAMSAEAIARLLGKKETRH